MFALDPPTEKYVYNIPRIQVNHETEFLHKNIQPYSLPNMIEYFLHGNSLFDYINRIYYCESIPNLTDNDRIEFRKRVSYIYNYHNKVYNNKNFDLELLTRCFPEYTNYINNSLPINVAYEKFKHHPSISPLFNGSGCIIL